MAAVTSGPVSKALTVEQPRRMQALVFDPAISGAAFVKPDAEIPTPKPGEALIKVTCAGICNTDLELIKGYMGFSGTLGHEFVGVVTACGRPEDEKLWLNQRVCADINAACGTCPTCLGEVTGQPDPHHCPNRTVVGIMAHNGGFAQLVCVPVANLVVVPPEVTDEMAAFTEPLAAAFEIAEQIDIKPQTKVVVLGDGKLGLLIAQVMNLHSQSVTLIGRHADKLALVAPLGVKPLFSAEEASMAALTKTADVVVEATGTASGLQQAMQLARPRGTIVLKSTVADLSIDGVSINLAPLVIDEIALIGSRCGPFDKAMAALAQNARLPEAQQKLNITGLIQGRYPLSQGADAIAHAQRKGTLKILLDPQA